MVLAHFINSHRTPPCFLVLLAVGKEFEHFLQYCHHVVGRFFFFFFSDASSSSIDFLGGCEPKKWCIIASNWCRVWYIYSIQLEKKKLSKFCSGFLLNIKIIFETLFFLTFISEFLHWVDFWYSLRPNSSFLLHISYYLGMPQFVNLAKDADLHLYFCQTK